MSNNLSPINLLKDVELSFGDDILASIRDWLTSREALSLSHEVESWRLSLIADRWSFDRVIDDLNGLFMNVIYTTFFICVGVALRDTTNSISLLYIFFWTAAWHGISLVLAYPLDNTLRFVGNKLPHQLKQSAVNRFILRYGLIICCVSLAVMFYFG